MSGVFADALALVIAIAIAVLVAAVRARWAITRALGAAASADH